jgi:hypothetical protein
MPEAWKGLRVPEIGGLAGRFHQLLHDGARAVDKLAPAQKGRADAVGFDADRPELRFLIEFDHAVGGERGEHAVGGGGGDAASGRYLAQRQRVALSDDSEDLQATVQRLH